MDKPFNLADSKWTNQFFYCHLSQVATGSRPPTLVNVIAPWRDVTRCGVQPFIFPPSSHARSWLQQPGQAWGDFGSLYLERNCLSYNPITFTQARNVGMLVKLLIGALAWRGGASSSGPADYFPRLSLSRNKTVEGWNVIKFIHDE